MSALLANYLTKEPRAGSMPDDARPVMIRFVLVVLLIAALALFA